jgi:hypothetical protein
MSLFATPSTLNMKQYVIDELRPDDYKKLKAYLDKNFNSSNIEEIYWIPFEPESLTDIQTEHTECQPFYFAIELKHDFLACELLVRTNSRVRCDCMSYATQKQLIWLISFVDSMFNKLEIIT